MYRYRALDKETLDSLEGAVEQFKPDLILVDTISAYMGGGRDINRQNEVGEFLGHLTDIAMQYDCAILATAHLNKQTSENPLFRIVGSIGFLASIRSLIFLGPGPADASHIAIAHEKANGAEPGPSLLFKKQGGGRHSVPHLVPAGVTEATAAEICKVERADVGRPTDKIEAAKEFILDYLNDEPVPWSQVVHAAEVQAIAASATMIKARKSLAGQELIKQIGKGKTAKWRLT